MPDHPAIRPTTSAAATWAPLARFITAEQRLGRWAGKRPITAFIYEFVRFGVKQAWACLFGGAMVALLIGTYLWYPHGASLARYDFLFLMVIAIQAAIVSYALVAIVNRPLPVDAPDLQDSDAQPVNA